MKLSDACASMSSNIAQKDISDCEGEYPIFGASGLIGNVDFYKQEEPYIGIVKDGAGVGRAYLLPGKSSVIGTMQYILPKSNADITYLYYAIQFMHLEKYYNGATIPHIYFRDYKHEPLILPELPEQQEKAQVLATIDKLISLHKMQVEMVDKLVKSRFVEMFGTPNEMDKWVCCNVENIADVTVGLVIKPTRFYTEDTENGVKAFRSLNVREMRVNDSDWVYFSKEGNDQNKKSQVQKGDVLVVRSGYPGTSCVVTDEYAGCNAIDIMIARPQQDKINPHYLCAFNNFPHGMNQIRHGTGGAAQKHFNVGAYNKVIIPVPPIELQNRFVEFLQLADKSKIAIQKSIGLLELLKASLMQTYFGQKKKSAPQGADKDWCLAQ